MEVLNLYKYLLTFIGAMIIIFVAEFIFKLIFHKDTRVISKKLEISFVLFFDFMCFVFYSLLDVS